MMIFPSATGARRAERTLAASGIPSVIMRPPASLTDGSCAHGVKFACRSLGRVTEVLRAQGIAWRSLCRLERGNWNKL